jgi:hypothetical protein
MFEMKESLASRGDGVQVEAVERKDGTITREPEEIASRFQEHMKELLGEGGDEVDFEEVDRVMRMGRGRKETNNDLQLDITWQEVKHALAVYKNGKAQGPGTKDDNIRDICIEIFKHAKVDVTEEGSEKDFKVKLARWFTKILHKGESEEDMALIRCMMLPKLAGARKMNKFRGISVMNTMRRLLSIIIMKRLDEHMEKGNVYMGSQYGFRRNKSIIQPCQILQHLQWLAKTRGVDMYVTFLDITKAYDNVNWELLWKILEYYGVPSKIVKMIKSCFEKSEMAIQFQGKLGEWFKLLKGVPQGDPLSPLLFSVYMTFLFEEYEKVIEEEEMANEQGGIKLYTIQDQKRQKGILPGIKEFPLDVNDKYRRYNKSRKENPHVIPLLARDTLHKDAQEIYVKKLMYADDTMTVCKTIREAINSTTRHQKAARLGGLEIHPDKLVYMRLSNSSREDIDERYIVGGKIVRRVKVEKYLGSRFTEVYDGGELNIKQRIAAARQKFNVKLSPIMENREMRVENKLVFYVSDVLPLLLHGVEYWNISQKVIDKLNGFQREMILKIAGRSYEDRITNIDLYEWLHRKGFKIYPMELTVYERKLRYFGMIVREGEIKEDLASQIYWSDVHKKCKWKDFEYEHVRNIKRALTVLKMSVEEANIEYIEKKEWVKKVRAQKGYAYDRWRENERKEIEQRHRGRIELREQHREDELVEEVVIRRKLP